MIGGKPIWSSLGIRQKILILFLIIAIVPLVIINIFWLRSSQNQLKTAAAERQSILLTSTAKRVNDVLDAKIASVTTQSQEQSIVDLAIEDAKLKILQYVNQNPDVLRVSLVDSVGNEKVVVKNGISNTQLSNIKGKDAFRVVTEVSNKANLGNVVYVDGQPQITVSVPLLSNSKLGTQNLSTNEALSRRFGGDIKGALVVDISLRDLWRSILSSKLGTDGYVYLVDAKGAPIAYPDAAFLSAHPSLATNEEVTRAVATLGLIDLDKKTEIFVPTPVLSSSEKKVPVLSSYFPISTAKWAIIGEEPIASVYSSVYAVSRVAVVILLIVIPLSLLLILLAVRSIVAPLTKLTIGATKLGAGDFNTPLSLSSNDELGVLAKTFNKMGYDLQNLISRIKEQNLSLDAERSKLHAVLDTIADGVIVLDSNYQLVLTNGTIAVLTKRIDLKAAYGKPWLDVFSVFYKDKVFQNENLSSGKLHFFKNVTLRSGDVTKYVNMTALHLENDPTGIAYILTVHDITEERELEAMKVDFVSMAAHELRTPMTAIKGYIDLIAHDADSVLSQKTQLFLQRVQYSSAQLVGLINNLLNVAKIERGAMTLHLEKLDWAQVAQSEVVNQQVSAGLKNINLLYEGPESGVFILADSVAISEVISNLISNALKYTLENGTVIISVKHEHDQVITAVTDDGIGIPPNAVDHLFTKFYRVNGGIASGSGGTGLGLYISKSIVELHHGAISVESEEGKGSVFHFELPELDQANYDKLVQSGPGKVNKNHGWITKNISR